MERKIRLRSVEIYLFWLSRLKQLKRENVFTFTEVESGMPYKPYTSKTFDSVYDYGKFHTPRHVFQLNLFPKISELFTYEY